MYHNTYGTGRGKSYDFSLSLIACMLGNCDFRKLTFPKHFGKYFIKIRKISAEIHENGKITAIGNNSYKASKIVK